MSQPQFHVGRLMAVMIPAGVTLAALIRPNRGLATALSAIMAAALLASILGVALRRGSGRGFWLGFGVFGWALLLLVALGKNRTNWQLDYEIFETIGMVAQAIGVASALDKNAFLDLVRSWGQAGGDSEIRVVLSAMVLAFAYLGGRIGRSFAGEGQDAAPTPDAAAAHRARIAATR